MLTIIGFVLIGLWIVLFFPAYSEMGKVGPRDRPFPAMFLFAISALAWGVWSTVVSLSWRDLREPYILHIAGMASLAGSISALISSVLIYRRDDRMRITVAVVGIAVSATQMLGTVRTVFMMLNNS